MSVGLPKIPEKRFEDYTKLPFSEMRETLDDLLVAMANLIERQWPSGYPPHLRTLLLGTINIAENTYKSIRYLCADRPADVTRKLEFAVSVPPLARTILDSIFTVIYLFDDIGRLEWYHKSGWREAYEEHERYKQSYGQDPTWAEYLDWQRQFVDYARQEFGITHDEANDVKQIRWWPNPGRMVRDAATSKERRKYLRFLNDWFYKTLSADSHLSWPGFARRAAHFLNPDEAKRVNLLRKYKSDCVVTSITLVLSLLSEIEIEFQFGRATRLKEVWEKLGTVFLFSKELYEMRYVSLL